MPICECGVCGLDAGVYSRSVGSRGIKKGQPRKVAAGHRTRAYCKRGHPRTPENLYERGCKLCILDQKEKWDDDHRLERNEQSRERGGTEHGKQVVNKRNLKSRYGITLEQYNVLLQKQDHKCAICKDDFDYVKPNVDHVHDSTKRVRGLLCWTCNIGLGGFKDNLERLVAAVQYLKETQ